MNKFFLLPSFLCILSNIGIKSTFGQTYNVTPPYQVEVYANIANARGIYRDDIGDIFVVAKYTSQIFCLFETFSGEDEGTVNVEQVELINRFDLSLNHGITYRDGYLYASSSTFVYRWAYESGSRIPINSPEEIVMRNIPPEGLFGHGVRALAFDHEGKYLYVTCGSNTNVDPDSTRSNIRRVDMSQGIPEGGFDWQVAEIFADGVRNSLGIGFDLSGVLWGVENGVSFRDSEYNQGNPAEEMNRFAYGPGTHYGYPYCYPSYELEGYEANTQFADPFFQDDTIHTDDWCRNVLNNRPAELALIAHGAPLGIAFYDGTGCETNVGAFPCSFAGDAVVAFHGSSPDIRNLPGYKVTLFKFDKETQLPTGESVDIVFDTAEGTKLFRPAGVVFNQKGHLFVTSDRSAVYKVVYNESLLIS